MTDLGITAAMSRGLIVFDDLEGAFDTSSITWTNVVAAIVVMLVTVVIAVLLSHVTRQRLSRPETDTIQVARFAATAVRWAVIFLGGAIAISFLGADVAWFTITIVLIIVVVVLVARPLLEKYAAGVALATATGFGIGDEIGVRGIEGRVLEISGRSTVFRLRDGRRVHIPNTKMIDEDIIVFTTEQQRRSEIDLEIGGHHTVESVEKVILDALDAVDEVASDPAPRVRARGFGVASVKLSVRIWHKSDLGSASDALDQAVRAIALALDAAGMALANRELEVLLHDRAAASSLEERPPGTRLDDRRGERD
ncbi:MAG: mechanosensitive ion channel [Chloroflexi bacterium]|nr:mechanosensitive ion channel [Chloroflexota bacterium]